MTLYERLLLLALFVQCVGLLVMGFMATAVDVESDQLGSLGHITPEFALALNMTSVVNGSLVVDTELLLSSMNGTQGTQLTWGAAIGGQKATLSLGLIWAVLCTLISQYYAIVDENEELELVLTWLVHVAILFADLGGRVRKLSTAGNSER